MNYIKKLEADRVAAEEQRRVAEEQVTELLCYLGSPKFNCGADLDGYVNVDDIIPRLRELRVNLL